MQTTAHTVYDIAILGGGMGGVAAALAAARAGALCGFNRSHALVGRWSNDQPGRFCVG